MRKTKSQKLNVTLLETSLLVENQITSKIYRTDYDYDKLLESIKREGILESLVVHYRKDIEKYEVISGNRRLKVSRELQLKKVPVTIKKYKRITKLIIVNHQSYRTKKYSDIIREIEIINKNYGLKQGVRPNLNPKIIKGIKRKEQLVKEHNKTKIERLTQINKLINKLSNGNTIIKEKELDLLDKGTINGTLQRLKKQFGEQENKKKVGDFYEVHRYNDDIHVYNKSSEILDGIKDNSVSCIVTSPPYFNMRDYNNGKNQLGKETSTNKFIDRLTQHFDESKRVLKNDGTLWVNLSDNVIESKYSLVPEKFVVKMNDKGWIVHDKIIWEKINPQYTDGNRTVMSHEYIYVFKKTDKVYYNQNWIKNEKSLLPLSYGDKKLKSYFRFDGKTITSSGSNNSSLRKECKREGHFLEHSATFPLHIPMIAIRTSSQEGDLVIDTFNGTGTSGKACQFLNRKYIGYDLNPSYIKTSEIRFNMSEDEDLETK